MPVPTSVLSDRITEQLLLRNTLSGAFFPSEARRLASACREMSERFLKGGRLLAFGRGPCATDAQHVSVEFVHPVVVGKRALPALDLSMAFAHWLPAIAQPDDIVMGFSPPGGDTEVEAALDAAGRRGAFTFALPGSGADYGVVLPTTDPFVHQELIEVLYHTLWETVHVFFEHRERGYDVGEAAFLYPFLGQAKQDTESALEEVAASIVEKAREDERLREEAAHTLSGRIAAGAQAIHERLAAGGTLICFGNGGSATDANDFVLDCVRPPAGLEPCPAISLSLEPASLSAVANDVGAEVLFQRQLIALARPEDVVVVISTSGNSANLVVALEEARRQKLLTVALLGYDGGEIVRRGLADLPLVVRCDYIPRIQEVHASVYHILRETLGLLAAGPP